MFFTSHARDQFAKRVAPLLPPAHRTTPMLTRMVDMAAVATQMRIRSASGDMIFRVEEPRAGFVVKRDHGSSGWTCVTVLGPDEMREYDRDPVAVVDNQDDEAAPPAAPTRAALEALLADVYVALSLSRFAAPQWVSIRERIERAVPAEAIVEAQAQAGYYSTTATAAEDAC
jgi:hypothetical protein